jgi:hypothetical protein
MSSLGDAMSSLGDAKSSLGDAMSSLGDAKSSLGDAKSSLDDAKSSLGDAKSSLGDAHLQQPLRAAAHARVHERLGALDVVVDEAVEGAQAPRALLQLAFARHVPFVEHQRDVPAVGVQRGRRCAAQLQRRRFGVGAAACRAEGFSAEPTTCLVS